MGTQKATQPSSQVRNGTRSRPTSVKDPDVEDPIRLRDLALQRRQDRELRVDTYLLDNKHENGSIGSPERAKKGDAAESKSTLPPSANVPNDDKRKAYVENLTPEQIRERFSEGLASSSDTGIVAAAKLLAASRLGIEFGLMTHPLGDANLPDKAPILWKERTSGREVNAAQFIRIHYAPWLGNGLLRKHIGVLDPSLGEAYSQRIKNHPEDTIDELPSEPRVKVEDPAEALQRIKDQAKTRLSRFRKK
ncbi:hypothetical protein [Tateyamaria sp. ANG-S1]|uniref:hypothetical protein n=1 Tax=Tateyamaria sp. ANG-S1 TaxID=1577905 RepID=UPI00126A1833|nr:hypothetical protein [Tateyamaria sp. ANG-S1]